MNRVALGFLIATLGALAACAENQHPVRTGASGSDRTDVVHEGGGGAGTGDRPATGGGSDRRGGKH